jgi:hypothetical protein
MHPIRIALILAACVTLVGGAVADRLCFSPRNPVLMLFAPEDVQLTSAQWADANTTSGLDRFIRVLSAAHRPVPDYLRALRDEYAGHPLESASFAVGCYWEGERALGKLNGVVSSRTGVLGSEEIVQVKFDPRTIDAARLTSTVKAMSCYRGCRPADAPLALDPQQQHDLSMHPEYAYLPLTAMQATKVNAALGTGGNPDAFLSPAQLRLKSRLAAGIARFGGADWLNDLQPDRSRSGLPVYLRSLEATLATSGE